MFGDTVITPPLSSGPLAGITRELIMEWSSVEERDLTLDEAKRADEVFITSSMRDVQGIERWDDQIFSPRASDHRGSCRRASPSVPKQILIP